MNEKAQSLGMSSTLYSNASGLDEENGGNVSSAADILKLTVEAWRNPVFRKIVATAKTMVESSDGQKHFLTNTNELLSSLPGFTGVKTGFTEKAGGCLVFTYTREGRELIGVVLGSTERGRFEDVAKITDWVFRSYIW